MWFNSPHSMNLENNIDKTFLKLVKQQFQRNNNTIRISCSCIRNITSIIASHNKSILRFKAKEYVCNFRSKELCPLQNQSLTPKVIYEATVINNSEDEKQVYFGASDTIFKERYRNHTPYIHREHYTLNVQSFGNTFGS